MNKDKVIHSTKDRIIVSDLFYEIYTNLNVHDDLSKKIKKLSKKELYLFLIIVPDIYNVDDIVVSKNVSIFLKEIKSLLKSIEEEKPDNKDIQKVINQYGQINTITSDDIRNKSGYPLPKPRSKTAIRKIKIKNLLNN